MSAPFDYIIRTYGVPAEIGRRVVVDGQPGIILEDRGNYIGVNFDSDKPGVIKNAHPTWRVEYGDMGKPRKMTRPQERYQRYLRSDSSWHSFLDFCYYDATQHE